MSGAVSEALPFSFAVFYGISIVWREIGVLFLGMMGAKMEPIVKINK
jgi:hypothetical protein